MNASTDNKISQQKVLERLGVVQAGLLNLPLERKPTTKVETTDAGPWTNWDQWTDWDASDE